MVGPWKVSLHKPAPICNPGQINSYQNLARVVHFTFNGHIISVLYSIIINIICKRPHFPSVYPHNNPHRMFGEQEKVCKFEPESGGEWFTNLSRARKLSFVYSPFLTLFCHSQDQSGLKEAQKAMEVWIMTGCPKGLALIRCGSKY